MTPDEFAQQIKTKYPQYSSVDNAELTRLILNKYPQYESKIQGIEAPSTFERVSNTIRQAGQRTQEQISGEGEFAGQSSLVRGFGAASTAATAIPQTAIQAIPGAPGDKIRAGLERLGGVIAKPFNKAIDFLSETAPIKGAAGQVVTGVGGTAEYVPNDLGFLEDALQIAESTGNIAEITAGAGAGPRAVGSAVSRTSNALMDVGREALDRTLNTAGTLAERVTPKSLRVALRINPPETRRQAVAELEDAYKTGLVEDRKAINNKLDKLAASQSFPGTTVTRDTLIRELAEEGYVPKIEGQFAKFDEVFDDIDARQRQLMEDLDAELAPIRGIENQTSLDRIRQEALSTLQQSPQIGAGLTASIRELERMFNSFAQKYGRAVTPIQLNDMRKEMNRITKAYKDEDIFKLDTAEAVGRVTRQRLDEVVPSGRVRQLNQEWARLNRVAETAKVLNNEIVEVGLIGRKLGSYVGTIGASLAGLSLAGPGGLVVASIFAQLGSDALATLLRAKKFSPELRDAIIKNLKDDPATVERLIREASPKNKAFLRNLLIGGASIGAAEYFLDEGEVGAAVLIGATGGKTPITAKALDRVEEYLDWSAGVKKVTGQELIDLKADAQLIAERAGLKATGGDKQLANELRKALDTQNFSKKGPSATTKTTDLLEEASPSETDMSLINPSKLPPRLKRQIERIRLTNPKLADEVQKGFNKVTKENLIDAMADMPDGIDPADVKALSKEELIYEFLDLAEPEFILEVVEMSGK